MNYTTTSHTFRNSTINKLQTEDKAIHEWYRFVLSFPPHLVQTYIHQFKLNADSLVLDPFCGTGTTLVECKKADIPSIGLEANPVAHFASQVKLDWRPDPDALLAHAHQVAKVALTQLNDQEIEDTPIFQSAHLPVGLRRLSDEQTQLLLTDSISPLPLHKTLVLRDCIEQQRDDRFTIMND